MRRWLICVVAGVIVAGSMTSSAAAARRALRVHIHTVRFMVLRNGAVIVPPQTYALGDEIFYVANISKGGHKIGISTVFCAVTDPVNYICTATDQLRRGTIVHIGTNPIAGPYTDVIVGGSGVYRNLRGVVRTKFSSDSEGTVLYRFAS